MRILTTDRLILRPLSADDFAALCQTLQDEKAMYAYGHAFSDEEVQAWLMRQIARGARPGFGLRAVIRRADGAFLGQCGITVQQWKKLSVPEIGYLIARRYWHNGYATEAAAACRDEAFGALGCGEVYAIIRDSNLASRRVAERIGMSLVGETIKYYHGVFMPHLVYRVCSMEKEQTHEFSPRNA